MMNDNDCRKRRRKKGEVGREGKGKKEELRYGGKKGGIKGGNGIAHTLWSAKGNTPIAVRDLRAFSSLSAGGVLFFPPGQCQE